MHGLPRPHQRGSERAGQKHPSDPAPFGRIELMKAGVIQRPNGDPFEEFPNELEEAFREFWTENANRLSQLYSGTGALKTDFTRTGKRSNAGAIEDGKRAVMRYFINNFFDTYNQNAIDLCLGKITSGDLQGSTKINPSQVLCYGAGVVFVYP